MTTALVLHLTVSLYIRVSKMLYNPVPLSLKDKLYLVLDTNVLLSHLNFLEELKDYAIKGGWVGRVTVPWAL